MNKLTVALLASAFAFGSASALADDIDMQPLSTLDADQIHAARAKAKAHWAKMRPEEQAATRKAARAKKQSELTALDEMANLTKGFEGHRAPDREGHRAPDRFYVKPKPMPPVIDMQPLSTLNAYQIKVAQAKAKEHWTKMTPEEQAAAKKAAAAKKQEELTALDEMATPK